MFERKTIHALLSDAATPYNQKAYSAAKFIYKKAAKHLEKHVSTDKDYYLYLAYVKYCQLACQYNLLDEAIELCELISFLEKYSKKLNTFLVSLRGFIYETDEMRTYLKEMCAAEKEVITLLGDHYWNQASQYYNDEEDEISIENLNKALPIFNNAMAQYILLARDVNPDIPPTEDDDPETWIKQVGAAIAGVYEKIGDNYFDKFSEENDVNHLQHAYVHYELAVDTLDKYESYQSHDLYNLYLTILNVYENLHKIDAAKADIHKNSLRRTLGRLLNHYGELEEDQQNALNHFLQFYIPLYHPELRKFLNNNAINSIEQIKNITEGLQLNFFSYLCKPNRRLSPQDNVFIEVDDHKRKQIDKETVEEEKDSSIEGASKKQKISDTLTLPLSAILSVESDDMEMVTTSESSSSVLPFRAENQLSILQRPTSSLCSLFFPRLPDSSPQFTYSYMAFYNELVVSPYLAEIMRTTADRYQHVAQAFSALGNVSSHPGYYFVGSDELKMLAKEFLEYFWGDQQNQLFIIKNQQGRADFRGQASNGNASSSSSTSSSVKKIYPRCISFFMMSIENTQACFITISGSHKNANGSQELAAHIKKSIAAFNKTKGKNVLYFINNLSIEYSGLIANIAQKLDGQHDFKQDNYKKACAEKFFMSFLSKMVMRYPNTRVLAAQNYFLYPFKAGVDYSQDPYVQVPSSPEPAQHYVYYQTSACQECRRNRLAELTIAGFTQQKALARLSAGLFSESMRSTSPLLFEEDETIRNIVALPGLATNTSQPQSGQLRLFSASTAFRSIAPAAAGASLSPAPAAKARL